METPKPKRMKNSIGVDAHKNINDLASNLHHVIAKALTKSKGAMTHEQVNGAMFKVLNSLNEDKLKELNSKK